MPTDFLNYQTSHTRENKDELLWKSFKSGDLSAYALIYRKYFFVLYQYGKKRCNDHELVKDTIQDVFIKIWNNRENLKETTSIKYYLLTALKRKLLDTFKSSRGRMTTVHEFSDYALFTGEEEDDDGLFERKEEVLMALNQLSHHQQKLIHLKFFKNLSSKEIADELDITTQSVYNAVYKALRSLRNQLAIILLIIGALY